MTDQQYESRVSQLMREDQLPEPVARERAALEGGFAGDVVIEGSSEAYLRRAHEAVAHRWTPLPS